MPRRLATLILIFIDLIIVLSVPFLALFIRLEGIWDSTYYRVLLDYLPIIVVIRIISFYLCGLYHRIWRYASISELLAIIGAVTLGSFVIISHIYISGASLPRSMYVIGWFLHIALIGLSRMFIRILQYLRQIKMPADTKMLIVGAGDAGAMIAREILHSRFCTTKRLIGFIDDAKDKTGQMLLGVKVLGTRQDIRDVVAQQGVTEIIIAMPSVAGDVIREIIQECKTTGCSVKTLPGIYELIDGKVTVQQLRNVELTDLLRRDPIKLDLSEIAGYLSGKRVLVTGAGGSIGAELCRQIAKMSPHSLTLLGKGENSIYEIDYELRVKYNSLHINPVIADIRDTARIQAIFAQLKPQVVFHAAAHKHVPLMEAQPIEAVRNNVFGTKIVAEAADRFGAEVFVMISTDKAVNPTSVMGATKRVAELIIQNMSKTSATKFVAVRFGNVLGSRGSVIPLFKRQIAKGGPITITHPEMRRYFMTIPEASQLVLQAGAMAKGGEVFVLDMGEPVKITDMAWDLVELSGLVPHRDIKIKYTGLRPGEKLFEELLTAEEGTTATKHKKIYVANLKTVNEEKLLQTLLALQSIGQPDETIRELTNMVPTYQSSRYRAIDSKELTASTREQDGKDRESFQPAVG